MTALASRPGRRRDAVPESRRVRHALWRVQRAYARRPALPRARSALDRCRFTVAVNRLRRYFVVPDNSCAFFGRTMCISAPVNCPSKIVTS
jgi:hypothetical protein